MNLSHLYYFCKLAELQHYTQAAQELYITQPSLSNAISCLETELGVALFKKRGRNIFLTKYGKEFYDHVFVALRALDEGVAIAKEHAGELGGIIDVGCISTIQGDYLPAVIRAFKVDKGPHVKFNIYQGQTNYILEGVQAERYDIGFCSFIEGKSDLYFVPILTQPLVAVVSQEHELAKEKSLQFSQLQGYPLVTYQTEQPIGRDVKSLLKQFGLTADQCYSDEVTLSGMAISELSVAIILKTASLRQFNNLVAIPLPQVPDDFRIVYMAFNKYTYKSHAVGCFIDYVTAFHSYRPEQIQQVRFV